MKKRICMVIVNYFARIGGCEKQCRLLADSLSHRGYDISILCKRKDASGISAEGDVRVIPEILYPENCLRTIYCFFSTFYHLFRLRNTYDILHVHLLGSHAIASMFISKIFNKKIFIKLGGGGQSGDIILSKTHLSGRIKLFIFRVLKPKVFCISDGIYSELKKIRFPTEKIIRIKNGIDTKHFCPALAESKQTIKSSLGFNAGTVVLYTGRFGSEKNLKLLLKAWTQVIKDHNDSLLILLGDGKIKKELEEDILNLNIQASVRIQPPVADTVKYYQASDIFILPSKYEGISNSLLEAMSCGLVCIASDIPGTKEIIDNGENGVLVQTDDEPELASSIKRMIDDKNVSRIFGNNARQKIISEFDIEIISNDYEKAISH